MRMTAMCRSWLGSRVVWIAALWLGIHIVHAAEPKADPAVARGERLAQMICSACHSVAPNQQFTPILKAQPPSFEEIANRPTTTEKSIVDFLKNTHWDEKTIPMTMPDPMLMANQRVDLARYILSMRPKPPK
jgi:mono/diheme cytochrome c family protein